MSQMITLAIDHVSHAFGTHKVLNAVSLEVPQGCITAVLGPSGGGKTTLLRAVCGFEIPDSGTITISGVDVCRDGRSLVPPEKRGVTIVPQEGALFPHLSVHDNIAFGLHQRRGAQATKRVEQLLELIELSDIAHERPAALSGGMQQRVALARALAPAPALVLLDEPFSALDASLRQSVRDHVVETLRHEGATALWVTHDQQEALSVADQVAVLIGGNVMQVAEPTTLYRQPINQQVAQFVGEAAIVNGTVNADGLSATCELGHVALSQPAAAGAATFVVRPEQIEISATDTDPASASCAGVVQASRFYGHDGVAEVRLASGRTVSVRVHARNLPPVGSCVDVHVNSAVLAFV
jgi:iron(III) transport system ATP-binding protein